MRVTPGIDWRSVAVGLAAVAFAGSAAAARADGRPAFEPAPCDMVDIAVALTSRLVCGTVAVPADRTAPGSARFRLAVVIIKPASGPVSPDPVVYIAGGPGSPLTSRAAFIATHEASRLAPGRDLVLVDQRGAGRSEPALCPGLARRQLALFASGMEQAALIRQWRETYAACRREMDRAGLKPEWFGTQVNAADFETVRQALGIARWNIYALSYGTSVAMTMMALHPESLRAVVLDSVFPPDPLPMTPAQSFARARALLFAACQKDAACDRAHPDLARTFDDTLRALAHDALAVRLPPGSGPDVFVLGDEAFRLIVNRALYSVTTRTQLPAFIAAAHDRRSPDLSPLIAQIAHGYQDMSVGDMAAVGCRDRPSWHEPPSADPPDTAFVPGMCDGWSELGPPPLIQADTVVPTLVLTGTADPITPPAFAYSAAAVMGRRVSVIEIADAGHGVAGATSRVGAFINDP